MSVLLGGLQAIPDTGGGHTLSYDVFQALVNRSKGWTHRFDVFEPMTRGAPEPPWPSHFVRLATQREHHRVFRWPVGSPYPY